MYIYIYIYILYIILSGYLILYMQPCLYTCAMDCLDCINIYIYKYIYICLSGLFSHICSVTYKTSIISGICPSTYPHTASKHIVRI